MCSTLEENYRLSPGTRQRVRVHSSKCNEGAATEVDAYRGAAAEVYRVSKLAAVGGQSADAGAQMQNLEMQLHVSYRAWPMVTPQE